MIDYFLGSSRPFLEGMGVEPSRLPSRADWLRAALADHERPDADKSRFYVAWLHDGELVGHSSLSHITPGETGLCHLHLWRPVLRRSGRGAAFLAASIDIYFERFGLKTVACQPYAENPAANRVLTKLGFRLVRRYRTVPSDIAFEQDVNRHEIDRAEWSALRG